MNFYQHHIGDYATATRHLSWEEDLAYRRLIEAYYAHEQPLPLDRKRCYKLAVCQTAKHRAAVDAVLDEFFTKTDQGYRHKRCDDELDAVASKKAKASQSARIKWQREAERKTNSEGNANASPDAMRTHSEGNAPTPIPNTQYPILDEVGSAGAREPLADLEGKLREAAGWQSEPAPKLAITGQIQALIDAGADLDLDVLPTVRAIAPQADSRASWNFFVKAIARSRDDRIAAAKIVSPASNGSHRNARKAGTATTLETLAATFGRGHDEGSPDAGTDSDSGPVHPADLAG